MQSAVVKLAAFVILIAVLYKVFVPFSPESIDADVTLVQTKEAVLLNESMSNLFPSTGIITVIDHKLYVANGFAIGNIIMIEGKAILTPP